MKRIFTIALLLLSVSLKAQQDTTHKEPQRPVYERHSVIATVSAGFADWYRQNLPSATGFENNKSTGFVPVYFKLEYAFSNHFGLAANFVYDGFYNNYGQEFVSNGSNYLRFNANNIRVFGGGLSLYYHFNELIPVRHLDVFVGIGGSINKINYSQYPQGDSVIKKTDHTFAPIAKAGVRYYLSNRASLFADAGYDKQSIFSIGFSCRFFRRH